MPRPVPPPPHPTPVAGTPGTADASTAFAPSATSATQGVQPDAWTGWRSATTARIALGRAGVATPTAETLRFGWAHALARDAVHTPLDTAALAAALAADGWAVQHARSQAPDRTAYLRRPDLGRRLDDGDAARLRAEAPRGRAEREVRAAVGTGGGGLCIVVGDGLSSLAVQRHAAPLLRALRAVLPAALQPAGPVVVVTQARVAVADDIGECRGADLVAMLIGERPGLGSPDSLGIYLTYAPHRGRRDAERNCISNVRPEGLGYAQAAHRLAWLVAAGLRHRLTGVGLKDESGPPALGVAPPHLPGG